MYKLLNQLDLAIHISFDEIIKHQKADAQCDEKRSKQIAPIMPEVEIDTTKRSCNSKGIHKNEHT